MVIVLLFLTNGLFYFFCLKILNWNLILFLLLIKITKHYIINLLKYWNFFFIVYIYNLFITAVPENISSNLLNLSYFNFK